MNLNLALNRHFAKPLLPACVLCLSVEAFAVICVSCAIAVLKFLRGKKN